MDRRPVGRRAEYGPERVPGLTIASRADAPLATEAAVATDKTVELLGSLRTRHSHVITKFGANAAWYLGSPPASLPRLRSLVTRAASQRRRPSARTTPVTGPRITRLRRAFGSTPPDHRGPQAPRLSAVPPLASRVLGLALPWRVGPMDSGDSWCSGIGRAASDLHWSRPQTTASIIRAPDRQPR